MLGNPSPDTHCSVKEFLSLAGMSKGTFFTNYRFNPAYEVLLDVKTDRMHRVWLAREAAVKIRAARPGKERHGNRGGTPVRICRSCAHVGHPRHTYCKGCGETFPENR